MQVSAEEVRSGTRQGHQALGRANGRMRARFQVPL